MNPIALAVDMDPSNNEESFEEKNQSDNSKQTELPHKSGGFFQSCKNNFENFKFKDKMKTVGSIISEKGKNAKNYLVNSSKDTISVIAEAGKEIKVI